MKVDTVEADEGNLSHVRALVGDISPPEKQAFQVHRFGKEEVPPRDGRKVLLTRFERRHASEGRCQCNQSNWRISVCKVRPAGSTENGTLFMSAKYGRCPRRKDGEMRQTGGCGREGNLWKDAASCPHCSPPHVQHCSQPVAHSPAVSAVRGREQRRRRVGYQSASHRLSCVEMATSRTCRSRRRGST